ncbi:Mob1/phocein family protein [Apiospora arundinis]|uniref:Mob1/phocein n=1 Tax=Apiospora arundinis TaxID=335852 RepID=A0ABR2ITC0_9PEZI
MSTLPPSSPRLPSPPPPAEIQLGPKSPGLGTTASRQAQEMEQTIADANAKRRIHPGTKAENMAAGPPLIPLSELESAFQLQEHLAALHYHHSASNTQPITRQTAEKLATPPPGIDRTLWLYELCRFLIAQCNSLIVGFLFDNPPCSQATCPEMRASEWQFLCAVHDQPKSCCAIDYCCHTLDWAANVVTNPKIFPSRFVVAAEGHDKGAVLKNLVNVFRRLHRIFAHAWFQHRGVFWTVEAQTGLYVFFKTVCDLYDLLPAENYKLPPEAEGLEPAQPEKEESQARVTAIARPPSRERDENAHDDDQPLHARRSNTARHSSRPSISTTVTTVIEEHEDENSNDVANKLKNMHLGTHPEIVEEESEIEVPVIVEGGLFDRASAETSSSPELNSKESTQVPGGEEKDAPTLGHEESLHPEENGNNQEQEVAPEAETMVEESSDSSEESTEEPNNATAKESQPSAPPPEKGENDSTITATEVTDSDDSEDPGPTKRPQQPLAQDENDGAATTPRKAWATPTNNGRIGNIVSSFAWRHARKKSKVKENNTDNDSKQDSNEDFEDDAEEVKAIIEQGRRRSATVVTKEHQRITDPADQTGSV